MHRKTQYGHQTQVVVGFRCDGRHEREDERKPCTAKHQGHKEHEVILNQITDEQGINDIGQQGDDPHYDGIVGHFCQNERLRRAGGVEIKQSPFVFLNERTTHRVNGCKQHDDPEKRVPNRHRKHLTETQVTDENRADHIQQQPIQCISVAPLERELFQKQGFYLCKHGAKLRNLKCLNFASLNIGCILVLCCKTKLMKKLLIFLLTLSTTVTMAQTNFHQFKAKTLDGGELDFATLKGKKVLVVNVASKCGLTPQYTDLQKLYDKYGGEKFEIIGFPANNFMGQEPGSSDEIAEFCQKNYGVTFTMMEKVEVKGKKQSPIYTWLTLKSENGVMDAEVSWNFEKFLIDENGNLVKNLEPKTVPMADEIVSWIAGK